MAAQDFEEQLDEFEIQIPPGKHLGNLVIEAQNVVKGFGDRVLMDGLNFNLPAGGIVGVIGPNGAGKTTLFRMFVGEEQPDAGELRIGPTVELGYVDQNRDALDPASTVFQEISGGLEHLEMGGRAGLRLAIQLSRFRPREESRRVVGRGTQPRAPGQIAPPRLERLAAGRAHQ
jgi:ATPase subunit of ABC transporter with duplicated ATPase domains